MSNISKKSKRISNSQGFTLIELIVVIAILGIILILALPQVQRIQNRNKTKKYETYQESLESAAKLYMDNNGKDIFGNNNSGCITIYYSDLKRSNLIKDFGDSNINCSDDATTFVEVRKANDSYSYASAIKCVDTDGNTVYEDRKIIDDDVDCDRNPDTEVPELTVTPSSSDWIKPDNLHIKVEIEDPSGLNKNIGIIYYWTDTDGNKVSEEYTYSYANKKGISKVSYTIPIEHVPSDTGDYNLVIKPHSSKNTNGIQDTLGNERKNQDTFGVYKLDSIPPTCTTTEGSKTNWTNQPFTINQYCEDGQSGCSENPFSKYYNTLTITDNITIKDNAGNETECPVSVYLDNEGPSCGSVSGDSTSWTNGDRNITVQCNDGNGSGCAQSSFTQYFSSSGATDVINISDTVGNVTGCTVNKYIDKIPPTIVFDYRPAYNGGVYNNPIDAYNNYGIFCTNTNVSQFIGLSYTAYDDLSGVERIDREHAYFSGAKARCGITPTIDERKWTPEYNIYHTYPTFQHIHFLQCNLRKSSSTTTMIVYFKARACDNVGNCSGEIRPVVQWNFNQMENVLNSVSSQCGRIS